MTNARLVHQQIGFMYGGLPWTNNSQTSAAVAAADRN